MKRSFYFILTLLLIFISCKNNQNPSPKTPSVSVEDIQKAKMDSIRQVREQETLQREKIFEALGDTVFGKVCYGMSLSEYNKAMNAFMKPLKRERSTADFVFGGFHFSLLSVSNFDNLEKNSGNKRTYISNLNYYLSDEEPFTLFYKGKLLSVKWWSNCVCKDRSVITNNLSELVSLFEKRYGKPNYCNITKFDNSDEYGTNIRQNVVARWETEKRKILIYYETLHPSERDKSFNSSYYQFDVEVYFLDKEHKKELNEHIIPILQKYKDEEQEEKRRQQESMENAL